jgi:hypothetical protein
VAAFAAFAAVSRDTGIRIGLRGVDSRLGIKLEDELGFWFSQEGVSGTGNQFAANSGAGPRDLMAPFGLGTRVHVLPFHRRISVLAPALV